MTRKKFKTFHEFILKDEKVVLGVLMLVSLWGGNILFTLLVVTLFIVHQTGIAVILSVLCIAGWLQLIKFYSFGGLKAMPKLSTEQIVWKGGYNGKEKIKETIEEQAKEKGKSKKS